MWSAGGRPGRTTAPRPRPARAAARASWTATPPVRVRKKPERSELQVLPQPPRLRAAHRDLARLLVPHSQDVVPAEPRHDLLDLVDVHQVRPMHAPEDASVEPSLKLVERPVIRRSRVLVRD